jgi:16S rRNA (cytosine1402-N4)-methyltransferase
MEQPAAGPVAHHVPVLVEEVLTYLEPRPGQTIVDATVGAGGHTQRIAECLLPGGRLIALDQDETMLDVARRRIKEAEAASVEFVHASFDQLPSVLRDRGIEAVDGLLADLGVCSDQIDAAERGFSFQQSGPLDMRLDQGQRETATDLVTRLDARALADIFWEYGEERFSRRIARKIVEAREQTPIATTEQLANLVRRCIPRPKGRRQTIDPATRVFQALRIAVNDELGALERLLAYLPGCIKPGGRVVIISFHSLEDRQVKNAFREPGIWQVLTRKPIQASMDELARNPRARSAKLRAAERLGR